MYFGAKQLHIYSRLPLRRLINKIIHMMDSLNTEMAGVLPLHFSSSPQTWIVGVHKITIPAPTTNDQRRPPLTLGTHTSSQALDYYN
jgi:plasmid maintenance system antidote protein VapI